MTRSGRAVALVLVAALSGCGGASSTGSGTDEQVVASLPDGEITRFELRHEPAAVGETPASVLERVIDRKLLAAHARGEKVEDDPEYLAALRRTREDLLVAALRRQLTRRLGRPTDPVLRAFADARPWIFAQRQVMVVEDAADLSRHTLDTASLDRAQWLAIEPKLGKIIINGQQFRVISVNAAPVDAVHDRELAVRLWQREQVDRALQDVIGAARSSGSVRYRPGQGPAAH